MVCRLLRAGDSGGRAPSGLCWCAEAEIPGNRTAGGPLPTYAAAGRSRRCHWVTLLPPGAVGCTGRVGGNLRTLISSSGPRVGLVLLGPGTLVVGAEQRVAFGAAAA